jgi:hypothetical protein
MVSLMLYALSLPQVFLLTWSVCLVLKGHFQPQYFSFCVLFQVPNLWILYLCIFTIALVTTMQNVTIHVMAFRGTVLCALVGRRQFCRGMCCIHLQDTWSEI